MHLGCFYVALAFAYSPASNRHIKTDANAGPVNVRLRSAVKTSDVGWTATTEWRRHIGQRAEDCERAAAMSLHAAIPLPRIGAGYVSSELGTVFS